jgi:hypothetical protein
VRARRGAGAGDCVMVSTRAVGKAAMIGFSLFIRICQPENELMDFSR